MSLRELADYFNQQLLRAAMTDAGMQPLSGEVQNTYQLLTSEDVGEADQTRISRHLEREEIDVEPSSLLPEHTDALTDLSRRTSVPLSTGERLHSRHDFKSVLTNGAVSVTQPDVTHVGGITGLKKIASIAEAFDVSVIPHGPLGPISFAASLQVGFCAPNIVMQEQDLDLHDPASSVGLQYLQYPETFVFEDGFVERPTGPGLGIDIDEDYVRKQAKKNVNWHNPVWHHDDGSVAEW